MIEMVYRGTSKDGKGKERTGLPKNIRQIGDAGSDKRVYIEDYVITFLEKTGCAVLLGEVWQNENMKCLFADGAVEIAEGEPNDDMWEKIYREMKQYFPGREVIGWAKKMEDPEEEPDIIKRVNKEGWLVDGQCSLYDFLCYFNRSDLFEASEYHTLGGLLLKELQHIPTSGETLQWNGFTFEVVDMDGARIDKVLVTTPIAEDNGDEEA